MKFVATKTAGQLDLQALHQVRERAHLLRADTEMVWMIYEDDQEVRRICLDVSHSENPKPSWCTCLSAMNHLRGL